jgi:ABC-type uncharacterized transport system permease subunit
VHRSFLHRLQLSRPHSRFSVRSALTDAPVASFTTLLLRATQHATGLMVKVAPLLPSRGLLSSHSQISWTHTGVLLQVGLNVQTSAVCIAVLFSGRRISIWLFVVNFNFIFSIGQRFRAGRYKISHLQQYLPVVRHLLKIQLQWKS